MAGSREREQAGSRKRGLRREQTEGCRQEAEGGDVRREQAEVCRQEAGRGDVSREQTEVSKQEQAVIRERGLGRERAELDIKPGSVQAEYIEWSRGVYAERSVLGMQVVGQAGRKRGLAESHGQLVCTVHI